MPGFFINGEGDGPSNTIETFRQHRWRIAQLGPLGSFADLSFLLLASDLQLPNFNVTEDKVSGGSLVYKYASEVDWEDVSITFYDTKGLLSKLKKWREQIWTPEDGLSDADSYKAESIFELLNGFGKVIQEVKLINSWPKKIGHGPLSYKASDIKTLQVVLTYDWAEETDF